MDPYINPDVLDHNNSFYANKLANYKQACKEYASCITQLQSLPSKIILQTTELCNLACPMCQIPKNKRKHSMTKEIFEQIVTELFPTLIELHPTNIGEPLMSPWFAAMCKQMQHFGVLLDLTTNGTLLTLERINDIVPIARDIKISFDGANAQTFEKIRSPANFNTVCNNIRNLCRVIAKKQTRPIVVALQMTLMKSNFQELPELIKLAYKLGINRVKAYHLFSFNKIMDQESLMDNLKIWTPVLNQALALGELYNIELQLAEPLLAKTQPMPILETTICYLPWHEAWINFDGNVYSCHSHGGHSAGNILQQSFASIWNSSIYQRIRLNFLNNRPTGYCYNCGMNYRKEKEHQAIVYDKASFLSRQNLREQKEASIIRWSSRMKPFEIPVDNNE